VILSFQLTDGTVMVQGNNYSDWWKLTPDDTGSYVNGKWSQLASLPRDYAPYAMVVGVLADGRLIIEGGNTTSNNFTLTNLGAIYDPTTNVWTPVPAPDGLGLYRGFAVARAAQRRHAIETNLQNRCDNSTPRP